MNKTERIILDAQTRKGGWTKKQLAQWGIPWPPPRGWKSRLILNNSLKKGHGIDDTLHSEPGTCPVVLVGSSERWPKQPKSPCPRNSA